MPLLGRANAARGEEGGGRDNGKLPEARNSLFFAEGVFVFRWRIKSSAKGLS